MALLAAWIMAMPVPAAHYVRLKSGSELTGDLLKDTPQVVILDLGVQVLSIPREAIEELRDLAELPPGEDEPSSPTLKLPRIEHDETTGGIRFFLGPLSTRAARTRTQLIEDTKSAVVIVANPTGSGSGFLLDLDGHLITNHHVVRNERYHSVTFFVRKGKNIERKKIEDVELVALNPLYDLALLKVEPARLEAEGIPLRPLLLSPRYSVEPGDPVFAVGNPGVGIQILEQSVSEGIVSSASRNFNDLLYLQTTAAVNPGNSGGPLLNQDGEVIGVVTFKAFFQEGIAFALPVRYLKDFLENRKSYAYDDTNPNKGYRYLKPE
jgi:serine protease Do